MIIRFIIILFYSASYSNLDNDLRIVTFVYIIQLIKGMTNDEDREPYF